MVKRRKVSPIKFMMNQWKEVFELMGDVGCTSLVTRIAQNLGLLKNASLSYIDDIDPWYIDYGYFLQAHKLKKNNNGQLVMMYLGYTIEIPLPDRNLGLYAMNSFIFELQVKEAAPHRSASARISRNPHPRYRADDPIPEGLAFTSYVR